MTKSDLERMREYRFKRLVMEKEFQGFIEECNKRKDEKDAFLNRVLEYPNLCVKLARDNFESRVRTIFRAVFGRQLSSKTIELARVKFREYGDEVSVRAGSFGIGVARNVKGNSRGIDDLGTEYVFGLLANAKEIEDGLRSIQRPTTSMAADDLQDFVRIVKSCLGDDLRRSTIPQNVACIIRPPWIGSIVLSKRESELPLHEIIVKPSMYNSSPCFFVREKTANINEAFDEKNESYKLDSNEGVFHLQAEKLVGANTPVTVLLVDQLKPHEEEIRSLINEELKRKFDKSRECLEALEKRFEGYLMAKAI